ncbi:hypothetical protein XOCgx_3863 [Xanthomonas oryzae pv. oryzicola]|nr:hypothetical protein XOCgx_3863 [Xanthomonas oryzae pv. oryzicola]
MRSLAWPADDAAWSVRVSVVTAAARERLNWRLQQLELCQGDCQC